MATAVSVLLLANPPVGDKVQRRLTELGVEVEYMRGVGPRQALHATVRDGVGWVVAMNAQGMGAHLKEEARKHGAKFVSVPPSWTRTQEILREAGFYDEIERGRRINGAANPLTHRPFAASAIAHALVGDNPPSEVVATLAKGLDSFCAGAPQVDANFAEVVAAAAERREPTASPRGGGPPQPPKKNGGLTNELRAKGRQIVIGKADARRKIAEALFRAGPDLDAEVVSRQIAARSPDGRSLNRADIYAVRRRVRAEMGLAPAPGTRAKNRLAPQPQPSSAASAAEPGPSQPVAAAASSPAVQAPAPPAAAGADRLPEAVSAAAQLLREEMTRHGLLGSITVSNDPAGDDIAWDLEERRRARGKGRL